MYQSFLKSQQWFRLPTDREWKGILKGISEKAEIITIYFVMFGKEKTLYLYLGHKKMFSALLKICFQ